MPVTSTAQSRPESTIAVLNYVAFFFPAPKGAAYSALLLAKALRRMGARIAFVVDAQTPGWEQGGEHEGFPVRSFSLEAPGKLRKLSGLLAFTRFMLKSSDHMNIFHVHGGSYVSIFIALWMKWWTGRKVVLKITSDGWDTPEGVRASKYGFLTGHLYRHLDGVVSLSSGQEKKCRDWGCRGLLATIPNAVDTDRYTPVSETRKQELRREKGIPATGSVLCYLGWLGDGKGTDVLFRVWMELRRTFSETVLLLAGDYLGLAESRQALVRYLGQHGLDPALLDAPQLVTVGRVPDPEHYLQAADIFLFPSRKEGFGTVQVEAMACGLPCIANDLPGLSTDIFPDESVGFRVAGNRAADYVRIASNLIRDPEKRAGIGRAARERAATHFSIDVVARQYLAFYRKLLES